VTVIDARGLRKEFELRLRAGWLRRTTRTVAAVDSVDLAVERGETLGYIGPNGAGKSTTLTRPCASSRSDSACAAS